MKRHETFLDFLILDCFKRGKNLFRLCHFLLQICYLPLPSSSLPCFMETGGKWQNVGEPSIDNRVHLCFPELNEYWVSLSTGCIHNMLPADSRNIGVILYKAITIKGTSCYNLCNFRSTFQTF